MKYGYTIIYVSSVVETLEFYKNAFGFDVKFVHESKAYGELDTGETTLAFASHEMGDMNLEGKYIKANVKDNPFGIELAHLVSNRPLLQKMLYLPIVKRLNWGQFQSRSQKKSHGVSLLGMSGQWMVQ